MQFCFFGRYLKVVLTVCSVAWAFKATWGDYVPRIVDLYLKKRSFQLHCHTGFFKNAKNERCMIDTLAQCTRGDTYIL